MTRGGGWRRGMKAWTAGCAWEEGDGGRKCQRTEEEEPDIGERTPRGKKRRHRTRRGVEEGINKRGRGEEREAAWAQITELKLGAVGLFRLSSTHLVVLHGLAHPTAWPHITQLLDLPGSLRLQGLHPTPVPQGNVAWGSPGVTRQGPYLGLPCGCCSRCHQLRI